MKKKIVAVILCGGMGNRISQITNKTPKSLIKILQKPIIWYVISTLLKNNIKEIIFPLGYKGSQIKNFILKNFKKEIKNFKFIDTGIKTEINERIKKISNTLKNYDDFILLNSDTIFNFNLKEFLEFHRKKNYLISLSGINMTTNWGSIVKQKNNLLKKFVVNSKISSYKIKDYEKFNAYRNTGISIISSKCLSFIKKINNTNFETSLYNKYIRFNKVGVKIFNGFWHPIETFKDLKDLKKDRKNIKNINHLKRKLILKN